jgi:anti-sigma regulatory factor (Ser/Thr protein kinase)/predicted DNA-binding transcriptional regulator AlpA
MSRLMRIGDVADLMGLSVSRVRQLANEGAIPSRRTEGGHRVFDLGDVEDVLALTADSRFPRLDPLGPAQWSRVVELAGLAEHLVWRETAGDLGLDVASPAVHVVEYAFGEMLNNAIEHSEGTAARIRVWSNEGVLAFEVADDGIGVFEKLRSAFGLPDSLSAIQELSKGKRTTDPVNHTGQGVFFTSKAVDRFSLAANGWMWVVDNVVGDQTVEEVRMGRPGTTVRCEIAPGRKRSMSEVFAEYTEDFEFARSAPTVKLLSYGARLVSRSEAKRLLEGLSQFTEVRLDFEGVESVGQGFVDEVFRVWASNNPGTRLVPANMGQAVRFMVERGLPGA